MTNSILWTFFLNNKKFSDKNDTVLQILQISLMSNLIERAGFSYLLPHSICCDTLMYHDSITWKKLAHTNYVVRKKEVHVNTDSFFR